MNLFASLRDSLSNIVTGMGTARDKSTGAQFVERLLTEQELHAMYRDDWVSKKIVNIPAEDMVRKGRQWKGDSGQITALENAEKQLKVTAQVKKGLQWARLYGGAALLLDDGGLPTRPIKPETFGQGALKAIHVVSRRRVNMPEALEDDIRSSNFGRPRKIEINFGGASSRTQIDPSRVIYIHGEQTPDTDTVEDFWGDSVLRGVYSAVQHAAKAPHGFAQLIDEAKTDFVAIKGLRNQVATQAGRDTLLQRWGIFDLAKGLNGVGMIDADEEEFITRQMSFADHDKLIMAFLIIVSGAADIPATRMLGQAPSGLNATGESDLRNYYNAIESAQETELGPVLDYLDEFLIRHALGNKPEDLWYEFRPLWTPTAKEFAEIALAKANAIGVYASKAIIDPYALKVGAETMLVEDGLLPGFEQALEEAKTLAAEADEPMLPEDDDDDPAEGDDEDEQRREEQRAADARPRTLYISRRVKNAQQIAAWARSQGLKNITPTSDMHVTVAYSRVPVDWMSIRQDYWEEIEIEGGARLVEPLGDEGAIVLLFKSDPLEYRFRSLIEEQGLSWEYDGYQPHITLTYDPGGIDLSKVEPYQGPIILGPERFEEIEFEWAPPKAKERQAA